MITTSLLLGFIFIAAVASQILVSPLKQRDPFYV